MKNLKRFTLVALSVAMLALPNLTVLASELGNEEVVQSTTVEQDENEMESRNLWIPYTLTSGTHLYSYPFTTNRWIERGTHIYFNPTITLANGLYYLTNTAEWISSSAIR